MFDSPFRSAILAAVLCVIALPAWADDKPLLSASTENPSPGETRPPPPLVRIVLNAIDKTDLKQIDECIADKGLKRGDYASLLRAVRINAGAARDLWFVRPTLEPFCLGLYGAHAFQYFLIEEQLSARPPRYRLVFQNAGDAFAIYPRQSHGLNDIEATGCIADGCRSERMFFDGQKYRPLSCRRTTFNENGQQITKARRCGADGGMDDQASGFNPSPP